MLIGSGAAIDETSIAPLVSAESVVQPEDLDLFPPAGGGNTVPGLSSLER